MTSPTADASAFPLSFAQERLWFLAQLDPGSALYNVPLGLRLRGELDVSALREALRAVVKRHEALRTCFPAREGRPVQLGPDQVEVPLTQLAVVSEREAARRARELAAEPFDLAHPPLLRTQLLRLGEADHLLVICLHHIVFDGWSLSVLLGELSELYNAHRVGRPPRLAPLTIQYPDYAVWQRQQLQPTLLAQELNYWRTQLAGMPELLELPIDRPRPASRSFRGGRVSRSLPATLSAQLNQLAQSEQTTLFVVLLAGLQALLARLSGQLDFSIGTPVAGREHPQTEPLIGFFANTLVLRARLDGNPSFRHILQAARTTTLDALNHQTLPFERLVEHLHPERTLNHTPFFQTVLNFQNTRITPPSFAELEVSLLDPPSGIAKFDLTVEITPIADGLRLAAEYSGDLFRVETVERLLGHWETLLAGAIENPDERLARLPLFTDAERQQIFSEWRRPSPNDEGPLVQALFEAEATRRPGAVALLAGGKATSYAELSRRTNQIAQGLRQHSVGREAVVAIQVERGPKLVAVMLGVLKAGAAFALLDLDDPPKRRQSQLVGTGASFLITTGADGDNLTLTSRTQLLLLESLERESEAKEILVDSVAPNHLACLSWSGRDLVAIEHKTFRRYLVSFAQALEINEQDVILALAAPSASVALCELLAPLACGATISFASGRDASAIHHGITETSATISIFTSAGLAAYAALEYSSPAKTLRKVGCVGGVRAEVASAVARRHGVPVVALYTPLGADRVIACEHRPDCGRPTVSIARAPDALLLEEDGSPTPAGAPGEICLAVNYPARGLQSILRTGDYGCCLEDGFIELIPALGPKAWIEGVRVDLGEIATALLADNGIADCVVRARTGEVGTEVVAYIVPAGPFSTEAFEADLRLLFPAVAVPSAFIPLTRLPTDCAGRIDERMLARFPFLTHELARTCEQQLAARLGSAGVAVVIAERHEQLREMPLAMLLPADPPKSRPPTKTSNRAAIVEAAPLELPKGVPSTLADSLELVARRWPEHGVLHIDRGGRERFVSYPQLLGRARLLLGALQNIGLRAGDPVIFQLEATEEFTEAFWACVLGGFVPVPVSVPIAYHDENATVRKLLYANSLLGRPPLLGDARTGPALIALGGGSEDHKLRVYRVDELREGAQPGIRYHSSAADVAIFLLTSGSTGLPKCVPLTHENILTRSIGTAQVNGFGPDDVSLNWMPLDHVGGIIMFHVHDVCNGCQQIHVSTTAILDDPLRWLDLIEQHRVSITWAPNFAFGLVSNRLKNVRRRWDLSSLRFILNAGEAIVMATGRRFLELLSPYGLLSSAMHPAWGMSETSSAVTFSEGLRLAGELQDSFVDLGVPIPGVSIRIVDTNDHLLREGEIGRVQVTGAPVMRGYHGDPELNRQAFTFDRWFVTGDLGFIMGGRLTLTGREKDVVIVNGVNYASHEIESVVEAVEGVKPSFAAACVARAPADATDALAIFFSPAETWMDVRRTAEAIRERVARQMGVSPRYVVALDTAEVPKTSIGKIERSVLRQRLERGALAPTLSDVRATGEILTLPPWFHRIGWQRKLPPVLGRLPPGAGAVIISDRAGLGNALGRQLEAAGAACARIEADESLEQVARMLAVSPQPRILVYLRDYGDTDAGVDRDIQYDLIHLAKVLHREELRDDKLNLFVAASFAQTVHKEERITPDRAACIALLKTIQSELPWVWCRHVDLPLGNLNMNAARLMAEMAALHEDVEVAYRGDDRLVAVLESLDFPDFQPQPLPFVRGGGYLVTGGLGGIGVELSRWLIRDFDARLVLVGRGDVGATLPDLDGDVAYECADVCDGAALLGAVVRAERRWGRKLDGIVHLAGVFRERSLAEETPDSFSEAVRSKVTAMPVLEDLLAERPEAFLVCFSSVNGFFAGSFAGAYSAACRYMSAFLHNLRQRRPGRNHCLSWSMWEKIGMSRGYATSELSRASGFATLSVPQGFASFRVALRRDEPDLLIGLDPSNRRIMRLTAGATAPLHIMQAYIATSHDVGQLGEMRDRFGALATCELVRVDALPLTADGEIERGALSANSRPSRRSFVPPKTELERRIAELWQELLHVSSIGEQDDFFALGGQSLLAVQLASRLRAVIGADVPVRTIFESPQLDRLAEALLSLRIESSDGGRAVTLLEAIEVMPDDVAFALAQMT